MNRDSFVTRNRAWGRPYKFIVKQRKRTVVPAGIVRDNGEVTRSTKESIEWLMKKNFLR